MKKFIICCLPALLCMSMNGRAQKLDFTGAKWWYTSSKKSPISQQSLQGKYIIIDFFATWCKPCLSALPHLDSLQKTFEDKLQIVAVTRESKKQVLPVLQNAGDLSFPFILEDSLFNTRFPHRTLPHEVIIDPNGNVLIETTAKALTFDNVRKMFSGDRTPFVVAKKDNMNFSYNKSLIENIQTNTEMVKSLSVVASAFPGVRTYHGVKKDSVYARYHFVNLPLIDLIQLSYGRNPKMPFKLNVKDSLSYVRRGEDWQTWSLKNAFCYEIAVPVNTPVDEMRRLMRADLESRFHLTTALIAPASGDGVAAILVITETDLKSLTLSTH